MVQFVCVKKWEKRNRFNFYWGFVKPWVSVVYNMGILKHFGSWVIETFCVQNLYRFWTILSLYVWFFMQNRFIIIINNNN